MDKYQMIDSVLENLKSGLLALYSGQPMAFSAHMLDIAQKLVALKDGLAAEDKEHDKKEA